MRSSSSLPASLLAAAAIAHAAQAAPPARIEIEYDLKRNGSTVAEVVERLDRTNGHYELTEEWKGRGLYALLGRATRKSQGLLTSAGPRPTDYVDERSGRDTQRVHIDWQSGTITRRYKGNTRSEPVPPDTQDRLSFLLALGYAARAGQGVKFHVVDARGMSRHAYEFAGRERIGTPAGEFDAVKLFRKNGSGETSEIWLAAQLDYLPVRIVVTDDDGTTYEHIASRIKSQ